MTPTAHAACFNYIVAGAGAGAGSAGGVVADRLTASGRHRVLLLAAGGRDRNIRMHIPLGHGKLFSNAKVDWLYATAPEAELNNRRIIQPRGEVLGGSSSINGLLYVRGQPEDFDHWRQLGNAGWAHGCHAVIIQLIWINDVRCGERNLNWLLADEGETTRLRRACIGWSAPIPTGLSMRNGRRCSTPAS